MLCALSVGTSVACAQPEMTARLLANAGEVLHVRALIGGKQGNSPLVDGVTKRLAARLRTTYGVVPPLASVRSAVMDRQQLLAKSVSVVLPVEGNAPDTQSGSSLLWIVSVQQHPLWLQLYVSKDAVTVTMPKDRILHDLEAQMPLDLPAVQDSSVVEATTDRFGVTRVTVNARPAAGYEVLGDKSPAVLVADALQGNAKHVTVPLRYRNGSVMMPKAGSASRLELLSTGLSDYRTSPWGRKANVEKAIHQHIDTVVVPQGSTFSFNSMLGGPITKGNGWFDSLIIVNGSTLEPAPGGGICQSSTTVYRAALLAGLPIVKRAPHSLYVHYYEMFGLGLDSTVLPGKQDLVFQNDTPGDIVIMATTGGTGVEVQFYGTPDGRTVQMDGPYVGPGLANLFGRPLKSNEIAWLQTVEKHGESRVNPIISAYGKMPRSTVERVAVLAEAQPVPISKPVNVALGN